MTTKNNLELIVNMKNALTLLQLNIHFIISIALLSFI